ncbi:hypothetical protein PV326_009325, partial [Microctonus aethiopoides]
MDMDNKPNNRKFSEIIPSRDLLDKSRLSKKYWWLNDEMECIKKLSTRFKDLENSRRFPLSTPHSTAIPGLLMATHGMTPVISGSSRLLAYPLSIHLESQGANSGVQPLEAAPPVLSSKMHCYVPVVVGRVIIIFLFK